MTRHLLQVIITVWIVAATVVLCSPLGVSAQNTPDTSRRRVTNDSLPFPIHDRPGDPLGNPQRSSFNFKPSNLRDSIEYDPKTNLYYVVEKIGNKYYRTPTAYTYEEYLRLSSKKANVRRLSGVQRGFTEMSDVSLIKRSRHVTYDLTKVTIDHS